MTQTYYSLITNNGLLKEAAANAPGGSAIDLTHIAVGDSNGTSYNPTGAQTALVHEVYRTTLTHVAIDENNPNQLFAEGVISEEIGSFYIREVGIFDSDGQLFAIGKYPETFKSTSAEGSGKRLYIRMILGFVNAPQVNLVISEDINNDPNFSDNVNNALEDINDALSQKLVKAENLADLEDIEEARNNLGLDIGALAGNSSESAAGIAQIATQAEANDGADDAKILTPLKLKSGVYGKRVFITSAAASSSSYVSFTNLSSDFKKYEVEFIGVRPSNDGGGLACQFSTNNGSSFTNSSYLSGNNRSSTADPLSTMTNNTTRLTLVGLDSDANRGLSNVSSKTLNGLFELFDPSNSAIFKIAKWNLVYTNNSAYNYTYWADGYGAWNGAISAVNAIRFFMATANADSLNGVIATGIFNLYGIR